MEEVTFTLLPLEREFVLWLLGNPGKSGFGGCHILGCRAELEALQISGVCFSALSREGG